MRPSCLTSARSTRLHEGSSVRRGWFHFLVSKMDGCLLTTVKTYVHCAAGVRVHAAAPILEALGFERVIPLQEGFATLANLGFDLAD